jgi:hypothetical protein
MTAHLRCDCGNQLRVFEHHVGRRVQCPACGKSHVVTADGITPALPAAGALAGQGSRGRKRAVLVLLLLLLLAAGAMTPLLLFRKSTSQSEGDDLALIPANAEGFGTLRLADLWKSPAMRKALKKGNDSGAKMEEEVGLRPEEIERLSGVSIDVDDRIGWIVVRTVAPFDVRKVFARLNNPREVPYQDNRYHLGEGPEGNTRALYLAGTRVMVMGTEQGVRRCLDFVKEGPATGPLEPIIALAAEGKHTAVAGVFPRGERMSLDPHSHLDGIQRITATLDVSEKVELDARAQLTSKEAAMGADKAIQKPLKIAQALLMLAQFKGGEEGRIARSLTELMSQVKIERANSELRATAHIDDGSSVAEGLLGLPRLLGQ